MQIFLCWSWILIALAHTLIVLAHSLVALALTLIALTHLNSTEKLHQLKGRKRARGRKRRLYFWICLCNACSTQHLTTPPSLDHGSCFCMENCTAMFYETFRKKASTNAHFIKPCRSPLHAFINRISVRFYEMDCIWLAYIHGYYNILISLLVCQPVLLSTIGIR